MNKALTTVPGLRIALLGYRSHPHVGGQGIYLHYLSKALANEGHEVVVFSGPPYPELAINVRLVKVPGLDLYAKEKPLRSLRFKNLLSLGDMLEWLSKLSGGFAEPYTFGRRLAQNYLEELKSFDIVHDNQSLCFGLLTLQENGCNVIATIHHPIHRDRRFAIDSAKDFLHRLLVRRWYSFISMQERVAKNLSNIITVSNCSRQDIQSDFSLPEKSIEVIPNGVDVSIFKPLPEITKNPFRIITTASSDQILKGLHILLAAFACTRKKIGELELIVIGKLKNNSLAQKTLSDLNLDNDESVKFISNISADELTRQYAEASIAVCPSLYEGFGIPVLEAMACGLPLISSNGGALPEVVGDAGILVEAGNIAALADAIYTLTLDENLQKEYSKRALERVNKHYCWQRVAKQYSTYYRRTLATC